MRYIFLAALLFLFQGCVTVKLKSVLPKQDYYSLDNVIIESKCKKADSHFGVNIIVLSPYEGKDILLYDKDSKISIIESYKWIDLPRNMIRNSLIKQAMNACVQIEQNPPLGHRQSMLRISVNDLYVSKDSNSSDYQGYIYLNYEILEADSKRVKSSIITATSNDINPAKALQMALNKALSDLISQIK